MIEKLKQRFGNHFPKGSFIRNVFTLMSGTVFAQALTILAAPILTRLFSPGEYGIYAVYTSLAGILAVLACWRYEVAIVLPEDEEDAERLLVLSLLICAGMTILTFVMVALFRAPFANMINAPELAAYLWLLPISILAAGLFQVLNYWLTRCEQYKILAVRQITNSTVTVAAQFAAGGIFRLGSLGLIAGSILGQLVSTVRLAWLSWGKELLHLKETLDYKKMLAIAREYKRFPLFLNLAALFNVLSAELPLILIAYYFNPIIVGFFVLGKRVVGMPLSVIEGAVAQVFYPQASEAYRDGNLKAVILNTFSSLFSIILVPILLLMIAGPDLIAVVFGEAWRMAGVFLVWLAPRILAQFISSPLSLVFVVQQRQDLNLKIDALLFVCNIGTVISGGLLKNSLLAIQLLGVGTFVCYSFACYKIFRLAEVHFSEVFQVLFSVARKAIPYILMPLLVFLFYHHAGIMVFVSVLSGCLFLLLQSREWGSIYRQ